MKIVRMLVRFEGEKMIYCGPDEATMTIFAYTDVMPDGVEYGLMCSITEVVEELDPDRHKCMVQALKKYREETQ